MERKIMEGQKEVVKKNKTKRGGREGKEEVR